jgi:hypothetical protein
MYQQLSEGHPLDWQLRAQSRLRALDALQPESFFRLSNNYHLRALVVAKIAVIIGGHRS